MNWFKTTWLRIKSTTPKYFIKIRKVAVTISLGCTAILAAQATQGIDLPTPFWRTVSYVLVAALAVAAMTAPPTDNKELSQQ